MCVCGCDSTFPVLIKYIKCCGLFQPMPGFGFPLCQATWWPPRTELGGSMLNGHAQAPAAKPPEPRDESWAGHDT